MPDWKPEIKARLAGLNLEPTREAEIVEEISQHLDDRFAELRAGGFSQEEARQLALEELTTGDLLARELGRVELPARPEPVVLGGTKGNMLENSYQDLRYAARMLRKNPGFTSLAVFTLALGIGATSSVFNLIQGVLLTPPPYPRPEQIMLIQPLSVVGQPHFEQPSTEQWTGWRQQSKAFQSMAGYDWDFDCLILQDGSEAVSGLEVTSDYFNVIGNKPLLGRTFLQSETPRNPELATFIILGCDLWHRRFHGDPDILGQKVRLGRREPLTVVGVMPPDLRFLPSFGEESSPTYDVNARVDYWLPVEPDLSKPKGGSGNGVWSVAGRLRPGVTRAQAQAELGAIAARQAQANKDYQGISARVQPLTEFMNRDGRRLLLPLLGAVTLVFLIACGNVAGLLLSRGLRRQQEYAVRCALGARRMQLFRQVLAESLLLALLGGALGVGLAIAAVRVLKVIGGFAIPRLDSVTVGWPVLAFCFVSAIIAALLAGLLPAVRASQLDPAQAVKGSGPNSSAARKERRLLGGVALLQTALTLALLVGAGLLVQTVVNLARVRPGYDTQNILTMSVMKVYKRGVNDDFHRRALERVLALPGVRNVAFVWGLPLTGNQWAAGEVTIEGRPNGPALADKPQIAACCVTEQYFDTMGMQIVAGRGFRASDNAKPPRELPGVVIINQAMARRFFPNENPVGKRLYFQWSSPDRPSEIVGVAADSHDKSLTQKPEPEIYFSFWQCDVFTKSLVVRTVSDPHHLIGVVERELRSIDPTVAIVDVKTMAQIRAGSVASQTFVMRLLVAFAFAGSVLALVGIYGVLSLSVGSRRREIAIRIAIGAQRRNVFGLVLTEGLKLIVVGLVIGTVASIALGLGLRAFLFGVAPADPVTLAGVAILFTAVALLACWMPARRAARVDPMEALRCE